jgi:hypothetical protein
LGAEAHILIKRNIENYIPDSGLYAYAGRHPEARTAVEFVVGLKRVARDHYNLKRGLKQAELDATGSMYPPGTPIELGVGNIITDFLTNVGISVEAHELKERDGVNELDDIFKLLEDNL